MAPGGTSKRTKIKNIEELLERLSEASAQEDRIAVGTMVELVGQKSFGPLLLLAGLIAFSPLSGVPGVPTLVAMIVLLTAGQILFGRKALWLPNWLLRRTVARARYEKALKFLWPIAEFVDRFCRQRLAILTQRAGTYFIAGVCALVAIAMPPLELVPFSATLAGAALAAFGLSLIAHDGVLTIVALAFTVGVSVLIGRTLL
jgi:hypothetical protein